MKILQMILDDPMCFLAHFFETLLAIVIACFCYKLTKEKEDED